MKIQVKFIAEDGKAFDDEQECTQYETLCVLACHAGFVQTVCTVFAPLAETVGSADCEYIPFDSETGDGREFKALAAALVVNWDLLAEALRQARIDAFGPEELADAVVNSKRITKQPKRK